MSDEAKLDEANLADVDEARLLEAIRLHPDDDTARLAYADFLDARGDRRGELVRIEIELVRLRPRLAELRRTLAPTWLATVGRHMALVLVSVRVENKIQAIRFVREASGMGLREAYDLVEAVMTRGPQVVREELEPDEAERLLGTFAGIAEVRVERRAHRAIP